MDGARFRLTNVLQERDINLVIEGARGVGTTSFANFLRFTQQNKKLYFTPGIEIRIEPEWSFEALLGAVIISIVRELELYHYKQVHRKRAFKKARLLSEKISETFSSFGINAFGAGFNYGKNKYTSQPMLMSSVSLGYHIGDLAALACEIGYKHGILIQLNNLDVGVVHKEEHLMYLLNSLRDYMQIRNTSWILVGDIGLLSFIARRVDRVDDIINYDLSLPALTKNVFNHLIHKRVEAFKKVKEPEMPFSSDALEYLYDITEGRLRYIFNFMFKLCEKIYYQDMINDITLSLVVPYVREIARERIRKYNLTISEIDVLKEIVATGEINVDTLATQTNKHRTYVSRVLKRLLTCNLITFQKIGREHIYKPSLDAKIGYLPE